MQKKANILLTKQRIIEKMQIILGTSITAFSTSMVLLPNKISTGGFSGIGTAIYYYFHFPIGTVVFFLNIPIFIITYIKIDKKVFFNSILGTLLLSTFLNIFQHLKPLTEDRFLACIYGGIISGIGSAITLKANASTGGSELLARIIKEYKNDLSISNIVAILDIIIITLNVIVFKKIEIGLYSAIAIFISGKMIDVFLEGINFAKMILIISPKYLEISDKINSKVDRGSTAIKAIGMYKNEERNILLCVASRQEIGKIRLIINETDENAFIIITDVREVIGEGFK